MSFLHSLSEMIQRPKVCGSRWQRPPACRYWSSRLRLEVLEARNLLSAFAANRVSGGAFAEFMYWADLGSHDIRRANLDGSAQQTLLSGLGTPPTGIALDVTGGHMYWAGGTYPDSGDIRRAFRRETISVDVECGC